VNPLLEPYLTMLQFDIICMGVAAVLLGLLAALPLRLVGKTAFSARRAADRIRWALGRVSPICGGCKKNKAQTCQPCERDRLFNAIEEEEEAHSLTSSRLMVANAELEAWRSRKSVPPTDPERDQLRRLIDELREERTGPPGTAGGPSHIGKAGGA
jgi:hypothetical protein